LTVSELLRRVDLSRPTLYRLLRTLQRKQFLIASGDPQRFRLGPAVAQLSHVWTAGLDLGAAAEPMMRRLRDETGETVALFVPQGAFRLCIAEMPSNQALSFRRRVGYPEPLPVPPTAKVILAYTAPAQGAFRPQDTCARARPDQGAGFRDQQGRADPGRGGSIGAVLRRDGWGCRLTQRLRPERAPWTFAGRQIRKTPATRGSRAFS